MNSGINEAGLKVLTLTHPDPVDDILAFYEEALAGRPWNMTARTDLPDQGAVVLSFTNVDDPLQSGTMTIQRDSQDVNTLMTVTFIIAAPTPTPEPAVPTPTP